MRTSFTAPSLAKLAFSLLSAALVSSCGGAGFDGQVYRGEGFSLRVPARPTSWEQLEIDGAALAFLDRATKALVLVNGRCHVDGEDVPLQALTRHLFLQFTERRILEQELVPFDGREALHTVLAAKLDGVPRTFDVWVAKKDGCVYDFAFIAPPEQFDEGAGTFRTFVRDFRTLPAAGAP